MSTIQEVVTTSMGHNGLAGYADRAGPVIADLVARERNIYAELVEAGMRLGGSEHAVRLVLDEAGLSAPFIERPMAVVDVERNDELLGIRHELTGLMRRIDDILGD